MSRADELYKKLQENNRGASVKNAASLSYDAAGAQSGGSRASQLYDAMMQRESEAIGAQYDLYRKYQAYQNYLASNPAAARARAQRSQDIYVGSLGSKEKQDAARFYYKYADTYGKLSPEKQAAEAERLNRSDWDVASYGDDVSKYADTDYGRYLWLMTYGDKNALKDYQSEFETTAARSLAMSKAKTAQEKDFARLYFLYGDEYGKMTPEQQAAEARRLYAENGGTQEWDEAASAAKMGNYNASDAYSRYWWLINYGDKDAMKRERDLYNTGVQNKVAKRQYEENKKELERIQASGDLDRTEEQERQLKYRSGFETLLQEIFGFGAYDKDDPEVKAQEAAREKAASLEADINRYERLEAVNQTTYDYMSRPDFEEKSQKGNIRNPKERYEDQQYSDEELLADALQGLDEEGNPNADYYSGKQAKREIYHYENWDNMTPEEQAVWYYIVRTEGEEAAEAYLDRMDIPASQRRLSAISEGLADAPWYAKVAGSVLSVGANALDPTSWAYDVIGGATDTYNPYRLSGQNFANAIREGVTEGWNPWAKGAYGAVMSGLDSAAGVATGGDAYTYIMGMTAAQQRARELWEQGASGGQILMGAGLDGIAEALFEKVSIDRLLDPKAVGSKLEWVWERIVKQGLVEASEETATGIANIINDIMVRGEQSEVVKKYNEYYDKYGGDKEKALGQTMLDVAQDLANQAGAGFVSGGLMGAAYNIGNGVDSVAKATRAESKVTNADEARVFVQNLENARAEAVIDGSLTEEADKRAAEAEARVKEKYGLDGVTVTEAGKIIESDAFGEAAKNRIVRKAKEAMESAASKEYLTTDSGVTEYAHNGKVDEGVVVTRIIDRDGERMYELGSGDVVSADSVTFGTKAEATVYGMLNDYKVDGESATQIAKDVLAEVGDNAETIKTAEAAMNAINAYNYGELGLDYASAVKTSKENALSSSVMNAAYDLGRAQYEARSAERQAAVERGELTYRRKGEGKVIYEDSVTDEVLADMAEKKIDKTDISALDRLASALGINIHLYATQIGEDGKRSATVNGKTYTSNGFYDHATGDIYIDVYSGRKGNSLIMFTLAHELTHFIAQNSPSSYKAMADFLVKTYAEKGGEDIDYQIQRQIEKAREDGREIDREEALEEVVADSMEAMFADGEVIKKLASENPSLAKRILAKIKEWLDALVGKYKTLDPDSEEGQKLKGWVDEFTKMQEMFVEALKGAKQGYAKAGVETSAETKEAQGAVGVVYDSKTASAYDQQYSARTWSESEFVKDRDKAIEGLVEQLGVSKDIAAKYIDDINSIAAIIVNDREHLDYEPNLDKTSRTLKPNSEYVWTLDFSTLCAKRLWYTGTFDEIQRALPNYAFTSEELVRLRDMMQERGYEVACGLCYVESTRREIGPITLDFIDRYTMAQRTGKPITRVNSKNQVVELYAKGKKGVPMYADPNYTPTLADLNTTDIDKVKVDHPDVYAAYLAFMNARGQAKPKLLETRAEYNGDIAITFRMKNRSDHFEYVSQSGEKRTVSKAVKDRNDHGGLRVQSFSDFELVHMIDMMQAVMDMAKVGLMAQAYTKVPAFADVFGDTGIKINLSLIVNGLDRNGNLIFDAVEGIDPDEAFRLRNKYSKNVGTIMVAKDKATLIAAMADDRIDFIIPFHKSSWKESLYEALGLTGYEDFTDYQNEQPIDPNRKIKNFDPKEYWDFSKTGDENAQSYLQKCREDGRIPKFADYQSYPGYWKLLIDFKMYSNEGIGAPQEFVRPVFDEDAAQRLLKEYSKNQQSGKKHGHQTLPVAKDVVRDFLAETKKSDTKRSSRETEDTSNRAILSNALEEAAQTPEEKTNLARYRETIGEINAAEERVKEINAEIAKGERDTARIAELQKEKAALEKKITAADSRLLKLEASTPLKDYVKRAKENTRKAVTAEYVAREAALRKERDAEIKAGVKDAQKRYRERLKELRERKGRAETKNKLERLTAQLRQLALRPSEGKYVPNPMYGQVLDFLTYVDNWTPSRNKNGELSARQSLTAKKRAENLKIRYAELKNKLGLDPETRASEAKDANGNKIDVDPINALLDVVAKIFNDGDKSLNDLTDEELTRVYQAAKAITHLVKTATRTISLKKALSIRALKSNFVSTVQASGAQTKRFAKKMAQLKEWYNWKRLRPKTVFEIMGNFTKNSASMTMYDALNDAELYQGEILMNLNEIFAHLMPGKGGDVDVKYKQFDKFIDPKNAVDVGLMDEKGNKYEVTHDMLVMLALSLSHPDNFDYIVKNGFTAPDKKDYYNGKTSEAFASYKRIYPPHAVESNALAEERQSLRDQLETVTSETARQMINDRINEIDETLKTYRESQKEWGEQLLENVLAKMDDYDRDWFNTWRKFAEASQKYLNEATQKMYGFDRATVENYFPIRTDSRFGAASFDSLVHDFTLEALGFMKARTGRGLNPLYLEGVSYVAQDHIKKVSQYAAMAPALRDVSKILSKTVTMPNGEPVSVTGEIERAFGKQGTKWIENLLADLNGARQKEGLSSEIARLIRSHYAGAVLTLNPSVSLGQAASFATATAILGHKAVDKGLFGHIIPGKGAASPELIAKWSALLYNRNVGQNERGASTDVGHQTALERAEQKMQFIFGWISAVDMYTVNRLWWASEYYVRDHSPELYNKNADADAQSDEYYEEVARMFNRVVQETQPNYTTMQRPDVLRNPNELVRSLTMFMTQRLQNASMLYESRRRLARYSYDYKNKVGVGTDREVTTQDVKDARAEFARSVIGVVESSMLLTGFKLGAALLLYRFTSGWRDEDKELTPEAMSEHLLDLFVDSVLSNYLGGSEAYSVFKLSKQAYEGEYKYGSDALLEENTVERVNKVFGSWLKLIKSIGSAREDGKTTAEEREEILLQTKSSAVDFVETALGLPINNAGKIVDAIVNWSKDIADGEGIDFEQRVERTNKIQARRVFKAFLAGDTEKVAKVEAEIGDQKKLNSAMMDYLNDEYKEGNITREQVTTILSDYLGKSDDDVHWWFEKHDADLPEGESWKKYTEFIDAVDSGKGLEETAKEYLDNGVKKQQLGGAITDRYKDEYVGYEKSGNKKAMEALKKKMLDGYEAAGYDRDDAEDNIDEWYRQVTLEEYKAGKISRTEAEKVYRDRYGLSDDEIYWKFQEIDAGIAEEDYGKYDDFYAAVETGKELKAVIKTYTDNGVTEKTLASQITKNFKPIYVAASNAERAKLKGYLLNAYVALGYDREKKSKDIDKWLDDAE